MSFFESPRFPDKIAYSAVGGPGFSTDVVVVASGYEARNQNWTSVRHSYDLAIPARAQSERNEIDAFFRMATGRAHGFRFKDYSDYTATAQLCETLTSTTFQLRKAYVSGATTRYRTITKPVSGTVQVYDGGSPVSPTIDTTTGVITFGAPPGGAVTADFEFDVPVRFESDSLRWQVINKSAGVLYYQAESLNIVEVRL